jgi:Flp pilus assembly protein TadG
MRTLTCLTGLARNVGGATAVETALLLPVFFLMVFGGMATATFGWAVSSLHFAVEDAARCASVKTTVCTSNTTITTYAAAKYTGPPISPTFTYSTAGCGHTVRATGTFSFNAIVPQLMNVPVSATSCFP